MKESLHHINIARAESVNLPPDAADAARRLWEDAEVVERLVDWLFDGIEKRPLS